MIAAAGAAYRNGLRSWVAAVCRSAAWVLAAAVVVTALSMAFTADQLSIDTATEEMIAAELPFRRADAALRAAFPMLRNNLVVVVEAPSPDAADEAAAELAEALAEADQPFAQIYNPGGSEFFVVHGLLYLDVEEVAETTDRLAGTQPLLAALAEDPSLRGLFGILSLAVDNTGDGEELETILAGIADVAEAAVEGRRERLSWQAVISGDPATAAVERRVLLVEPRRTDDPLVAGGAAMAAVKAAAEPLAERHGAQVRLTGDVALDHEELGGVRRDVTLAAMISFLLVAVLLFLGLGSLRLIAATLLTLIVGLAWTAAFAALAIGHLNMISAAFGVLFIGLGVDFGIHFVLRYREGLESGGSPGEALAATGAGLGPALTLSAIAAAIGFLSFVPTAYAGLAELGAISGGGMIIALFASLTVLPALLTVLPGRPRRRPLMTGVVVERLTARHARPIVAIAAVVGLASLLALPMVRFDYNPLNLKDPGAESVRALDDLYRDHGFALYGAEMLAPNLAAAAELADRLGTLAVVEEATSLAQFVPDDQEEKLDLIATAALFVVPVLEGAEPAPAPDDAARRDAAQRLRRALDRFVEQAGDTGPAEAAARLRGALGAVGDDPVALARMEQDLLFYLPGQLDRLVRSLSPDLVSIDDLPTELRERYVAADGRARVEATPVEDLRDTAALEGFVAAVREVAPHATGGAVQILESGRAVAGAMRQATLTALVLVTILLIALLRRPADVALVIVPLALAGVMTLAASALLDLPFNFANVIVLPLLLGLGAAGGIHLVMRYRGAAGPLLHTSTPRAVLFSALTTIGSFASLAVSSHRGTASMGMLLTIAIVATLLSTLIFLPALMTLVEARRQRASAGGEGRSPPSS